LKSRKSSLFLCSNFSMLLSGFYICIFKHEHYEKIPNQTLDFVIFFAIWHLWKKFHQIWIQCCLFAFFIYLHHLWCYKNYQLISRFVCLFAFISLSRKWLSLNNRHLNIHLNITHDNYIKKMERKTSMVQINVGCV